MYAATSLSNWSAAEKDIILASSSPRHRVETAAKNELGPGLRSEKVPSPDHLVHPKGLSSQVDVMRAGRRTSSDEIGPGLRRVGT